MSKEYYEKFKDPRWQKKRLEILKRDDFKCYLCGDKESQLHVHHTCYVAGRDPWEYKQYQLITLCENCHKAEHDTFYSNIQRFISGMRDSGFISEELDDIICDLSKNEFNGFKKAFKIFVQNYKESEK